MCGKIKTFHSIDMNYYGEYVTKMIPFETDRATHVN